MLCISMCQCSVLVVWQHHPVVVFFFSLCHMTVHIHASLHVSVCYHAYAEQESCTPLVYSHNWCEDSLLANNIQVAQLSQRDCAAGWVSYGQKLKTRTGRQYLWTFYVYIQPSNQIRWKMQNKGYYTVQGHLRSSRWVPIKSPYATSY